MFKIQNTRYSSLSPPLFPGNHPEQVRSLLWSQKEIT